jgi:hypothetical protein
MQSIMSEVAWFFVSDQQLEGRVLLQRGAWAAITFFAQGFAWIYCWLLKLDFFFGHPVLSSLSASIISIFFPPRIFASLTETLSSHAPVTYSIAWMRFLVQMCNLQALSLLFLARLGVHVPLLWAYELRYLVEIWKDRLVSLVLVGSRVSLTQG